MRKTALLLALVLLLSALPALGEGANPFAAEALRLEEVSFPEVDLSPLSAKAAAWGLEDMVFDHLTASDIQWLSMSPSGNRMAGLVEGMLFIYDQEMDEVIPLVPDDPKGIEDPHGNFQDFLTSGLQLGAMAGEFVVWSPNERYLTFKNWAMSLMQMRLNNDLVLADTEAGTLSHLATFPNRLQEEGAASVIQACFSQDSGTLFYTLYGMLGDMRAMLYSYDLQTGDIEALIAAQDGDAFGDLLQLVSLPGGRLGNIIDSTKASVPGGIFLYGQNDIGWYRGASILPLSVLRPRGLFASPDSGRGILHFASPTGGPIAVSTFTVGEHGISGHDKLLVITSPYQEKAETLSISNLYHEYNVLSETGKALVMPLHFTFGKEEEDEASLPEEPMYLCQAASLSADGEYALLWLRSPLPGNVTEKTPNLALVLVELSTLRLIPVEYPGTEGDWMFFISAGGSYQSSCLMAADGKVMINARGNSKLYRLCK